MAYDCTDDVQRHKFKVRYWMRGFANLLQLRADLHDASKLLPPEKACFDEWTPKLKEVEFGSQDYADHLRQMGECLKHHYQENRHHPEHYENGVDGMTLHDLVEMLCDWMAASEEKGTPINLEYFRARFKLSDQLVSILRNTLKEEDLWNSIAGVPVIDFIQE